VWATFPKTVSPSQEALNLVDPKTPYAVQLVRQINYGPLESKRYFIPSEDKDEAFVEVTEKDLLTANFQKLNS
jgi:hypothetical protein